MMMNSSSGNVRQSRDAQGARVNDNDEQALTTSSSFCASRVDENAVNHHVRDTTTATSTTTIFAQASGVRQDDGKDSPTTTPIPSRGTRATQPKKEDCTNHHDHFPSNNNNNNNNDSYFALEPAPVILGVTALHKKKKKQENRKQQSPTTLVVEDISPRVCKKIQQRTPDVMLPRPAEMLPSQRQWKTAMMSIPPWSVAENTAEEPRVVSSCSQPGAYRIGGISTPTTNTHQHEDQEGCSVTDATITHHDQDEERGGGGGFVTETNDATTAVAHNTFATSSSPPNGNESGLICAILVTDHHATAEEVMIDEEEEKQNSSDASLSSFTTNGGAAKYRVVRLGGIAMILLVLLIGSAVALAVLFSSSGDGSDGNSTMMGPQEPFSNEPDVAPQPDPVQFDYHCYRTAFDILLDQLKDVNNTVDTYVICPDTTIKPGLPTNPAENQYWPSEGDYPLWPIRSNTTIKCGLDGSSSNNCMVKRGWLQYLAQPVVVLSPEYEYLLPLANLDLEARLENIVIQGVTFEGPLDSVSEPLRRYSVLVSQSGTATFQDCHWKDMDNSYGLIIVRDNIVLLEKFGITLQSTASVVIRDSTFRNITIRYPLLQTLGQEIILDRVIFYDLKPSPLPLDRCLFTRSGGFEVIYETKGGCEGILYCGGDAFCAMTDSCVMNSQTRGPFMNLLASNATQGLFVGNYLDTNKGHSSCELGVVTTNPPDGTDVSEVFGCESAFEATQCDAFWGVGRSP